MFDFTAIAPRRMHNYLKWLGKQDWFDIEAHDGLRTAFKIDWGILDNAPSEYKPFINSLHNTPKDKAMAFPFTYAMGNAMAFGPKVFVPTVEQFDAMTKVDINIPIRDFRSPYPTLVIKIPEESSKALAKQFNWQGKMPEWSLISHKKTFIFVLQTFDLDVHYAFQERPQFPTIEDALHTFVTKNQTWSDTTDFADQEMGLLISRAVINTCLMLTHYGYRDGGPLYPDQWRAHRENPKLAHLKSADFRAVELTQNVTIRETRYIPLNSGSPTGYEVKPHWRRGHWRRQAGFLEIIEKGGSPKLSFVRPCFVRPDRVIGDIGDSQTTYRA